MVKNFNWFWVWLATFLGLMLVLRGYKWLVVPLVVRRKQTMPLRRDRRPTEADALTPEMQAFFGDLVEQFRAEGFEVAANVRAAKTASGVESVELLMLRRDRGDYATVLAALTTTVRTLVFEVATRLPDGRAWFTASSSTPTIFPPRPGTHTTVCAWVRTAAPLYAFHRRRLEAAGLGHAGGVLPEPGDEIGFLERNERQVQEWTRQCGYRKIDTAAGLSRYTIKGAYLCTWRMLEPVKSRRLRRRERLARAEWQALGMADADADAVPAGTVGVADAGASDGASPVLPYTAVHRPGTIQYLQRDGVLTVLIGRTTVGQALAQRWVTLAFLAVIAVLDGRFIYGRWKIYRLFPKIGLWALIRQPVLSLLFLTAVLLWFPLWRLTQTWRNVTLQASHAGLAFERVPSRPHRGFVPRADLETIVAAVSEFRVFGPKYRLAARARGAGKAITLALGVSKAQATALNQRLQQAMGLQIETPPGGANVETAKSF